MKKRTQASIVAVSIVAVLLLVFGAKMFYIVKPGERAVVFKKFGEGLDKENILAEGFHMVAPWNDMIKYDVREQKSEDMMDVLYKEGLSINVDVTVIFN
ncbi:MAG: SPFH domain-containing protein, partial [Bacteroidales bacterium]|nr:SPFH domain-containing protein [Bacteroidales bacterium]